jgi:hypothetical protein
MAIRIAPVTPALGRNVAKNKIFAGGWTPGPDPKGAKYAGRHRLGTRRAPPKLTKCTTALR